MNVPKLEQRKEARETIDSFLKLYPEHDKAVKILDWRNQLDRESCDFFLELDRRKDEDPPIVWTAYKEENLGQLEISAKMWDTIVELQKSRAVRSPSLARSGSISQDRSS